MRQLRMHVAHLLCVLGSNRVVVLKTCKLRGKLSLLSEELLSVFLVAGFQSLDGVVLHLSDFALACGEVTLAGLLLSHDTGRLRLNLCEIGIQVPKALVNHLLGIFHLIQHRVDVSCHDILKSGQNSHVTKSSVLFVIILARIHTHR